MTVAAVLASVPGAWPSSQPLPIDFPISDAPLPNTVFGSVPQVRSTAESTRPTNISLLHPPAPQQSRPIPSLTPSSASRKTFETRSTRSTANSTQRDTCRSRLGKSEAFSPVRRSQLEKLTAERKKQHDETRRSYKEQSRQNRKGSRTSSNFSISTCIANAFPTVQNLGSSLRPAINRVSTRLSNSWSYGSRHRTKTSSLQPYETPQFGIPRLKRQRDDEDEFDDASVKLSDLDASDVFSEPFDRSKKAKFARFELPPSTSKKKISLPENNQPVLLSVWHMRASTRNQHPPKSLASSSHPRSKSFNGRSSDSRNVSSISAFAPGWITSTYQKLHSYVTATDASSQTQPQMGQARPQSAPDRPQPTHQDYEDLAARYNQRFAPHSVKDTTKAPIVPAFAVTRNKERVDAYESLPELTGRLNLYPDYERDTRVSKEYQIRKEQHHEESYRNRVSFSKAAEEAAKKQKEKLKRIEEERAKEERRIQEEHAREEKAARAKESLISPLSHTWEAKIDTVQNQRDPNAEVTPRLSRHDFGTVIPKYASDGVGWLNDTIIMDYMGLVAKKGLANEGQTNTGRSPKDVPRFHAFNSHLYSKWTSTEKNNPNGNTYQAVARWVDRAGLAGSRLLRSEMVFIPINEHSHWTLLMISGTNKTISYYDSMRGSGKRYTSFALDLVAGILGDQFNENEWTVEVGESARQTNGLDCGVFVCMNTLALVKGLTPATALVANDMPAARRHIAAILLNGGFEGDFDF